MAVYTNVSRAQIEQLIHSSFDVGRVVDFEGISDGIENSNFFVTTDQAGFVLTLFERVADHDVPYFMDLTAFLADKGVHCGRPIAASDGRLHREFNGKQSALIERLSGASITEPDVTHARQVGAELGRFHRASVDFPQRRHNSFGLEWMEKTIAGFSDLIEPSSREVARQELHSVSQTIDQARDDDALAVGTVHGDLFQDNVLFHDNQISGVIDFYYACTDVLIYDLAIAINDWCFDDDRKRNSARADAMIEAYQSERKLSESEVNALPAMYRRAAFRFWISRQHDACFPRDGEIVTIKDPGQFYDILMFHRNEQGITAT